MADPRLALAHPAPAATPALADLIALGKPRITAMVLITATGGYLLAPAETSIARLVLLLIGTALVVASANALNMYIERDIDRLMSRTRERPLPSGRMEPGVALAFGILTGALAVPLLTIGVGPLTGFLGLVSLALYVAVYTPLKQRTPASVWVGAFPGAAGPLLGWTAATQSLDLAGLALFGVLFIWQVPHFHAIAMFRTKEYRRAGLKTLPGERGPQAARRSIVIFTVVQVAVSLTLTPLGVAGTGYLVVASVLGAAYLGFATAGWARQGGPKWAKQLFFASILYLPALFGALVLFAH